MAASICELPERGVVAVTGPEAAGFLQGLVTSDVEALAPGRAAFAALLTPQGKILFDFLAVRTDDGFRLDVARPLAADLAKRLKFYKLRAKVEIADLSDATAVWAIWGEAPPALPGLAYADPRLEGLGWRVLAAQTDREAITAITAGAAATMAAPADWQAHRIGLGVPEGGLDFAYGDAFPHDADMDDLAGVDFAKGCYVGQEVVSRMKHRGTARRRIVAVTGVAPLPAPGTEVVAGGRAMGVLGSSAGARGLALLRLDRVKAAVDAGEAITADGVALTAVLPAFARFRWPDVAAAD